MVQDRYNNCDLYVFTCFICERDWALKVNPLFLHLYYFCIKIHPYFYSRYFLSFRSISLTSSTVFPPMKPVPLVPPDVPPPLYFRLSRCTSYRSPEPQLVFLQIHILGTLLLLNFPNRFSFQSHSPLPAPHFFSPRSNLPDRLL